MSAFERGVSKLQEPLFEKGELVSFRKGWIKGPVYEVLFVHYYGTYDLQNRTTGAKIANVRGHTLEARESNHTGKEGEAFGNEHVKKLPTNGSLAYADAVGRSSSYGGLSSSIIDDNLSFQSVGEKRTKLSTTIDKSNTCAVTGSANFLLKSDSIPPQSLITELKTRKDKQSGESKTVSPKPTTGIPMVGRPANEDLGTDEHDSEDRKLPANADNVGTHEEGASSWRDTRFTRYTRDSDDESVYAESIFSEASLPSSISSLGEIQIQDELIKFIATLIYNRALSSINDTALQDPGIGPLRFQRNIRRLVAGYGRSLTLEAHEKNEIKVAKLLQSRRFSSSVARRTVQQADRGIVKQTPIRDTRQAELGPAVETEENQDSDASIDSTDSEAPDTIGQHGLEEIKDFLLNSEAYEQLKSQLLEFAHEPYERRIVAALADKVVSSAGSRLSNDAIRAIGREISWVPPQLFQVTLDVNLSVVDHLKGFVEDTVGETWNWWPLTQRKHALHKDLSRLEWQSPSGSTCHVDLPNTAASAVFDALRTEPSFIETFGKNSLPSTETGVVLHETRDETGFTIASPETPVHEKITPYNNVWTSGLLLVMCETCAFIAICSLEGYGESVTNVQEPVLKGLIASAVAWYTISQGLLGTILFLSVQSLDLICEVLKMDDVTYALGLESSWFWRSLYLRLALRSFRSAPSSESFPIPLQHRVIGKIIAMTVSLSGAGLLTLLIPRLMEWASHGGLLGIFALWNVVGFLLVLFLVPKKETRTNPSRKECDYLCSFSTWESVKYHITTLITPTKGYFGEGESSRWMQKNKARSHESHVARAPYGTQRASGGQTTAPTPLVPQPQGTPQSTGTHQPPKVSRNSGSSGDEAALTTQNSAPTKSWTDSSQISNAQSTDSQPPVARHVYLCVRKGSSYHFETLRSDLMKNDVEFFSALKKNYLKTRGFIRYWFSMWRYDHCAFFRFHKYGVDLSEPTKIDFPQDTDPDYDFTPRPLLSRPPEGPITEGEFRDHFYRTCYPRHTWHRHQRQRWLFCQLNKDAIYSLPQRKQALEMQDGRREVFWGILARERRCFAWVFAYGCFCNIPGVIFFFLWLFQWKHTSDLQDATVPIQLSLSLTVCFAALLYESREGDRR